MTIALLAFFLVPLLAAASVRVFSPQAEGLRLLLSFSGAFLVGVAFLHLLPELYGAVGSSVGLWILGGFLLQVVLEHFSMGIEHGHMHMPPPGGLPALTLFSLSLHSFAEGIPFADPGVAGDMHFLAGVLMHKIPMAIALITVMQRAGLGQGRTWVAMVLFASAAPLGILFGDAIGRLLEPTLLLHMLGLAIGMLMHIGTTIIFESAPGHRFHAQRFAAVLLGAVLSIFSMHG